MKNTVYLPKILLSAALLFGATAMAHEGHAHEEKKEAPAQTPPAKANEQAEWMKTAISAYPLTTCVVSGDKLEDGGEMGDIVNYVHKTVGKPDRLVRVCCKGCIKDFRKNPEKFLKKIDEAAAKAKSATPVSAPKSA